MSDEKWYARENDLIGGWCVMTADLPPSAGWEEGAIAAANMVADESTAREIALAHNALQIMMTEHWQPEWCGDGWGVDCVSLNSEDLPAELLVKRWPDPFTAITEGWRWFQENKQ
jgi:hypothetical protein